MYIHAPDPHPGRCKNLRPEPNVPGELRRCLDRDNHASACRFQDPKPYPQQIASGINEYRPPESKRWVPPWEVEDARREP